MALEIFKILNNLSPNCLNNLISKKQSNYSFRYSNILDIQWVRTSSFDKNSFWYATWYYGTAGLNNSGQKVVSPNIKVCFSSGVAKNVDVVHASSHIFSLLFFILACLFAYVTVLLMVEC